MKVISLVTGEKSGFSLGRLHTGGGGDLSPPIWGDKALMGGGLMRGDIDLIGGT